MPDETDSIHRAAGVAGIILAIALAISFLWMGIRAFFTWLAA